MNNKKYISLLILLFSTFFIFLIFQNFTNQNTKHFLISDEEIHNVRLIIQNNKNVKDKILTPLIRSESLVDKWLKVPLSELSWRIPDSRVFRAFNDVASIGDPQYGTQLYRIAQSTKWVANYPFLTVTSTYPYMVDFDDPFKLISPLKDSSGNFLKYPSNDFLAYYKSNFTDKSLLTGEYIDDGQGWYNKDAKTKHWFVAHAHHQYWKYIILPGVLNLSRAYILTGDIKYAHRSAALLARIADVYPGMDYEKQSREKVDIYKNSPYPGKIFNYIWETDNLILFAEAYDNIRDSFDNNYELQKLRKQSAEEIKNHIEKNILDVGIKSIQSKQVKGNFGMHQKAFAMLIKAKNLPNSFLDVIFKQTGPQAISEGLDYSFYNYIHRDGLGFESPGYNLHWINDFTTIATYIDKNYLDVLNHPQIKRLLNSFQEIIVNDSNTPALGDTSDYNQKILNNIVPYQIAFNNNPSFESAFMYNLAAPSQLDYNTYESLFLPNIKNDVTNYLNNNPKKEIRSRIFDSYGLGILNNSENNIGLSLFYGAHNSHHHRDLLHFDLYAYGRPLMPDFGYPDAMNNATQGIFTWSNNTVAHNTVVVNQRAQNQSKNIGILKHFASNEHLQLIEVETPYAYKVNDRNFNQYIEEDNLSNPQIAYKYSRTMLLVSNTKSSSYIVDLFHVNGGQQHDYILHQGVDSQRKIIKGDFNNVQSQGTLAGPNIKYGEIYDDQKLNQAGVNDFSSYMGSGYQHIFNIQAQKQNGNVIFDTYLPEQNNLPAVNLRTFLMDTSIPYKQKINKVLLGESSVSPINNRNKISPVSIIRSTFNQKNSLENDSLFISIMDPYLTSPNVESVKLNGFNNGYNIVRFTLKIKLKNGYEDILLFNTSNTDISDFAPAQPSMRPETLTCTGACISVVHFDDKANFISIDHLYNSKDGGNVILGNKLLSQSTQLNSELIISKINFVKNSILVNLNNNKFLNGDLKGKVIFVSNPSTNGNRSEHAYTILDSMQVDKNKIELTLKESLITSHGKIKVLNPKEVYTDTLLQFREIYAGMFLYNSNKNIFNHIVDLKKYAPNTAYTVFKLNNMDKNLEPSKLYNENEEYWISPAAENVSKIRFEEIKHIGE